MDQPFVPIRLLEVIGNEVGVPRNDGTAGSALYAVPIRLSAAPPREWAQLFISTFDNPPEWTSMHRRGICSIQGDRVVLDGTTIEEVGATHAKTMRLAEIAANREYPILVARRQQQESAERARIEQHRGQAELAAKKIKFD